MHRLVYVSTADESLSAMDLQDILEAALRNNGKAEVRGTVLFNGVNFMQVLEGPKEGVEHIYSRICADDRHHHIMTIFREDSSRRAFDEAPMTLNTVNCPVGNLPDGMTLSSDINLFLPAGLPSYLHSMIQNFNTTRS